MSDLIEKKDVVELLNNSYVQEDGRHNWRDHNNDCIDRLIEKVKAIPTIDAVEVVRCGECKHSEPSEDNSLYCKHWDDHFGFFWDEVKTDDFCSYGERKEIEHE